MNWQNNIVVGLVVCLFFSCSESQEELRTKQELVSSFPNIELLVNKEGMSQLQRKREEAIKKHVLESSSSDLVDATAVIENDTFPCLVRLKGDWVTHLKAKKWSFRVELKKGREWKGMSEFSLQNPIARDYLSEWVWHKMMEKEGILATQYLFCSLTLNGEKIGVYACEEHFTKNMLERNNKQLGMVVKMEENELWADRVNDKMETKGIPYFVLSEIDDYGGFKSIDNYQNQRQKAVNLVYDYKFSQAPSSQIFVVEKLAKYFALVDLHRAYHSLFWHNQRFYYNPSEKKLEPVGYDGFTEAGPWLSTKKDYLGKGFWQDGYLTGYKPYLGNLFNNKIVFTEYIDQLKKISSKQYISSFLQEMQEAIQHNEKFIQTEYGDYKYDREYLIESGERIESALQLLEKKDIQGLPYTFQKSRRTMPEGELAPIPNVSVKAYSFADSVRVYNYHHTSIVVEVGSGERQNQVSSSNKINAFLIQNENPPQTDFSFPKGEKWIYFKVQGVDSLYKTEVKKELPPNYKLK